MKIDSAVPLIAYLRKTRYGRIKIHSHNQRLSMGVALMVRIVLNFISAQILL